MESGYVFGIIWSTSFIANREKQKRNHKNNTYYFEDIQKEITIYENIAYYSGSSEW